MHIEFIFVFPCVRITKLEILNERNVDIEFIFVSPCVRITKLEILNERNVHIEFIFVFRVSELQS